MALPYQSIATIDSPQFINLQPLDINPLMSSCEIKVFYIGENRNRSYISKQVAIEMAKSLRGAPIVGYYKKDKQDFADHGEQVIFDDEGIHFNVLTRPYGFVAPDAKVWFKKFEDSDEFGNKIEREYLMTTGYLWTGQFEEVQSVLTEGKAQSMELDENTLEGHWATNVKNNIEFFIINDAIFTKLCILGDDTEPCFEGASVTKPDISSTFSKTIDNNFKQTLFSMMNELKDALKGGNGMVVEENLPVEEEVTEFTQEENIETSEPIEDSNLESTESEFEVASESEQVAESVEFTEEVEEVTEEVAEEPSEEFAKEEEEEEEAQEEAEEASEEEKEDEEDKYSLLEQNFNDLQTQYNQLKAEYDALVEFKAQVENEKKDALIAEFYMLSDEDKKEIKENKEKYSLDEIKAKLAVICYEKKVNFDLESSEKNNNNTEQEIVTLDVNFQKNDDSNLPDWVKAVKEIEDR